MQGGAAKHIYHEVVFPGLGCRIPPSEFLRSSSSMLSSFKELQMDELMSLENVRIQFCMGTHQHFCEPLKGHNLRLLNFFLDTLSILSMNANNLGSENRIRYI